MPTVGDKVSNLDPLDLPSASAIIYAVDGGDFKVDKDGLQNWIGIGKSGVKLVKGDGTVKYFQPALNTNSSRWTSALIPALEQATTNSKIFLYCGEYGIPSGASMVDYLDVGVTGVEVRFEKGSALIYENEVDAGEDYAFFSGTVRHGKNFGAYPDSGVDMQKRIQAAFFSMPPTGDPIETIADYDTLGIRTGRLLLDSGGYLISKTIWMTSHQQMYGDAGRPVNISAMVGFAPDGGSEKFMIRTARYKLGELPAANFNFDIHIVNVSLSTTGLLNTKLSGLEYACAQGGLLDLATNGMGMRGVVIMPSSGLFKINKLWSIAGNPYALVPTGPEQRGPHLDIQSCGSIEISNLSLEGLNWHTGAPGDARLTYSIGTYLNGNLAGLMAYNCDAIIIHNLVGESTSSLATFKECRQTSIGQADCVRANLSRDEGPGVGEVMVKFADCLNIELGGITGAYFDKLYEVSTQGTIIAEADGGNSQVERSGGYLSGYRADYLRANSITFPIEGTTVKAKTWTWGAGGTAANSFGQFFSVSTEDASYIHILAQQVGGGGGEFPDGTSLSLDAGGLGGVYIPSKLRVEKGFAVIGTSSDPTTSSILDGYRQTWYNSTTTETKDWINIGNVMYQSEVYFRTTQSEVKLIKGDGTVKIFKPLLNTNASRWTSALVPALQAATTGSRIYLSSGKFGIPSGESMTDYLGGGVTDVLLYFSESSALIYETPADAGNDSNLFVGVRNPINFGADPTGVSNSQPAFLTTRFSLPLYDGVSTCEAYPGAGTSGSDFLIRQGSVVIEGGTYLFESHFYINAYQSWKGNGERVVFQFGEGLAPSVVADAFGVCRSISSGTAQSNFTSNVSFHGVILAAPSTGNAKLRAIQWNGAQSSVLSQITTNGFSAGIYFGLYTNFTRVTGLDITNCSGSVGPALHFDTCNDIDGDNISITTFNDDGSNLDGEGDMEGAIRFDESFSIALANLNVENTPRGIVAYNSSCISINGVDHTNQKSVANAGLVPAVGTVTLDIDGASLQFEVTGLSSRFVESVVTVDSSITIAGNTSDPLVSAPRVLGDYTSKKVVSDLTFPDSNAFAQWRRDSADTRFYIISGQADGNPSLSIYSSDLDGTNAAEHINIARANGGAQAGYTVTVSDIYATNAINTLAEFRVDGVKVVGNQESAIADANASTATGTPTINDPPTLSDFNALVGSHDTLLGDVNAAITQLNLLLAAARSHGLIDT